MAVSFINLSECIKSINLGQIHMRGFLILILILLFYTCTGKNVMNKEFDHLILSQRWLPTACIEYVEKNPSSGNEHYCVLSNNFKTWRIHGLWPTQGNSLGPFFCNRSMPFDIHQVKPIESDLELYWPNIEGGKSIASLWQHEWEKHGTCAAQLEPLNNELKYFNATLSLFKSHSIQMVFTKNKIFPSEEGINISNLFYILKNMFGKVPEIHCINEVKTKRAYLSEIRLCYNKNLDLIDCKYIPSKKFRDDWGFISGLTNCPKDGNVIFSDNINPGLKSSSVNSNDERIQLFGLLMLKPAVLCASETKAHNRQGELEEIKKKEEKLSENIGCKTSTRAIKIEFSNIELYIRKRGAKFNGQILRIPTN